ncbi:hypothetical protein ABEB36_000738 [Hypothenemus hampei]|uniref:tRNA (guanine-N(7)-)-methyltransferase non-catalytic subunit wuho n=1 Tax=Hypothenemus hampei TaxID=57062 RepID=A0ABD1FC95_HYPHA
MLLVQEAHNANLDFKLVLAANDHLIEVNSNSESVQCIILPEIPHRQNNTKEKVPDSNNECKNIVSIQSSRNNEYIAVTTENKQLIVFDQNFRPVKNIMLSRVSNKVCFSKNNDLLVADRTGDVYLYKIKQEETDPDLLLGHLSVILDMIITPCGKYIITCDRDEKIRVSHYPNTYNIATYCLGHTEFVSSLRLLSSNHILLSGSGDGTVRIWNFLTGKQLALINTNNLIDQMVIEKFVSKMDLEKIEVTVVPVTDIQVGERENEILLTVTLYNVNKLFLYHINRDNYDYKHYQTIEIESTVFYCNLNSRLYILAHKLLVYEFLEGQYIKSNLDLHKMNENLLQFNNSLLHENDIALWYKRKYDNVQEYMERKKLRLEAK